MKAGAPAAGDEGGRQNKTAVRLREVNRTPALALRARGKGKRGRFARAGEAAASLEIAMASERDRRKYAPGRTSFAKLPNLPSPFANLLEDVFCGFGKNPSLPSAFAKLLELL
jgi:hypothetical protein